MSGTLARAHEDAPVHSVWTGASAVGATDRR